MGTIQPNMNLFAHFCSIQRSLMVNLVFFKRTPIPLTRLSIEGEHQKAKSLPSEFMETIKFEELRDRKVTIGGQTITMHQAMHSKLAAKALGGAAIASAAGCVFGLLCGSAKPGMMVDMTVEPLSDAGADIGPEVCDMPEAVSGVEID